MRRVPVGVIVEQIRDEHLWHVREIADVAVGDDELLVVPNQRVGQAIGVGGNRHRHDQPRRPFPRQFQPARFHRAADYRRADGEASSCSTRPNAAITAAIVQQPAKRGP